MEKNKIKKILKRGSITVEELRSLHEGAGMSQLLTAKEVDRLNGIYEEMTVKNEGISLTYDDKRELLSYITGQLENVPMEECYHELFDLDLLTEEEQQFLVDISLKLEGYSRK